MNRHTEDFFPNSRWSPIHGKISANAFLSPSTTKKKHNMKTNNAPQDAPLISSIANNDAGNLSVSTTAVLLGGELGKISSSSSPSRRRRRAPRRCRTTTSVIPPNLTTDLWQIDHQSDDDGKDKKNERRRVRLDLSKNQVVEIDASTSSNNDDERDNNNDDLEKSLKWYCKSDYTRIDKETRATVRQIQRGLPERFGLCFRGLEHEVYPGSCRIRANNAQNVVLLHSSNKTTTKDSDDDGDAEVLASRYAAATKDCQEIAYQIGIADARIANKILYESSSGSRDQMPKLPQRRWERMKPSKVNSM